MEKLQRKNFAIFVVGIMLISTIACQSLFLNKITELQVEEKNSTANAPSASQHNISTPYMYTINQISNSVVYNASFTIQRGSE
jgi:hypothetical protein